MKKLLALTLSLVLLLGLIPSMAFSAAAADPVTITPTGVLQHNTTQHHDWRVWLKVGETIPDGAYYSQDVLPVTLTDKDGNVLGETGDGKTHAGFLHDGPYLMLQIFGGSAYTAQNTVQEGDTIVIAAGTYAASNTENSITIAKDIKLIYAEGAFALCHTMGDNAVVLDALTVLPNASNATCVYVGLASSVALTFSTDWSNRFFPADPYSGVYFTHGETTTRAYPDGNEASGLPVENYTEGVAGIGGGIYFNGFGTAVAGDTLTIKGNWYSLSTGEEFTVAYPITFTFDGSAWAVSYDYSALETVKVTHLDVITSQKSAGSIYTQLPHTNGITVDDSWATRFFPLTEEDGGFFNGVRFELDAGGGMPIQSAAGAPGLYVSGFGTAVAGDKVVIKGRFYSKNRETGVKNGEYIEFIAPVEFTFDGEGWTRTSAIPEVEIVYENEYTGSFTNAGSQLVGGTNPDQLYLKGSDGLAGAFAGDYTDNEWNQAPLTADGEDSGFFLNGEKVDAALQQYSYSERWYFASGIRAANAGDILVIKGTFVNPIFLVKLNIEESTFIWDGTKWADYIEYTYSDFSVKDVNQVIYTYEEDDTTIKYRHFYLNIDGTVPGSWDKFLGLQISVDGGEKQDVRVGNNGSTSVICFDVHSSQMAADIAVGTTMTLHAGKAIAAAPSELVAVSDGIRLTADYTLTWNGTEWGVKVECTEHAYDNDCDTDCNNCGEVREINHTYDDEADVECNVCGYNRLWNYKVVDDAIVITGYKGSETSLVVPASIAGLPVKTIGSYALSYKELTSVTLPNGLETIEASAFRANPSLVSVIFPSSLKTIGDYAFYECSVLNPINLRNSVETIGDYAFFRTGARVAYLPANLKSIGAYAFGACSQLYAAWYYGTEATLADVTMGEGNGYLTATEWHYNTCHNHTYTGDCDAYCDGCDWVRSVPAHTYDDEHDTDCNVCGDARTNWFHYKVIEGGIQINEFRGTTDRLVIPSEINNLPVIAIANYACSYNDTLVSVEIPDTVKTISGYAFRNCPNLQSIKLPADLEIINRYMFYECTSLTAIDIPAKVKVIDEFAFARSGLTELVIPDGIETIGAYAYFCTRGFTDVHLPTSVKTIGNAAFGSDYDLKYIWCDGSEADYAELFIDENNSYFRIAEWHYDMCDEHSYTGDCDVYCDTCDYIRTAPAHTYDDEYDTDCNVCGDARTDWFHCKVIEGGIQINEFRGTTDRLVIPSEINNLPVIAIANYACSYNDTLVSVEIPDTVKT
ncbi:MAG: leucine-rich repeat domain-containing protein, partial [Clostridia bacterium]|nr:leucine-rich repeat domain-containing protein [Clostridia bacterium]